MNISNMMLELVKNDLDPFLDNLFEGGAFGHLSHPFEDLDLTFGQMKTMITKILSGKTDTFEKIDGQQISFSWKGGRLIGARNKGHLKEFGKNALTAEDMRSFIGRSGNAPREVINAFYVAMVDLEKALSKVSASILKNLFQEGKRFMNTEIVAEETTNVIPYYKDYLVFHGLVEYDIDGNPIRIIPDSGKQLEDQINAIGQSNQSKFQIKGPNKIILKNFSELPHERDMFLGGFKKLQGNMPENTTIKNQQEVWWKDFILYSAKEVGYKIPDQVLEMLVGRWGRREKAVNTLPKIASQINDENFKKWVIGYDKNEYENQYYDRIKEYEIFFLKLGAEVLTNASGFLTASPIETVSKLAKGIQRNALQIKKSKDPNDIERLKDQLEKMEKIGKNKIVGSEGVVFSMNNKLYKLTGIFAPINQVSSIIMYKRPKKELMPDKVKEYAVPSPLTSDIPKKALDLESQSVLNLLDKPTDSIRDAKDRMYESTIDPMKCGDCFNNARSWAMKNAKDIDGVNVVVVHGKVTNAEGKTFDHAWIEKGNEVIDPTQGVHMDKSKWYKLVHAKKEASYTPKQAGVNMVRSGKVGPWYPNEIDDRFVFYKGFSSKKRPLNEGGNVVYTNSALENKFLEPTIKNALKIWSIETLPYEIIGSKNKPLMNDIDVAIGWDDIAKLVKANPQDRNDFWSKVELFFKSHQPKDIPEPSFKVNKGLDQIHISAPIVGQEGKFVQIDLMVGDVGFMKTHLSGAGADSQYKAVYRNVLLADIFAHSHEPTKDPNVLKKYQIHSKKGVQVVYLTNKAGKIEKTIPETVYKNMDDVAAFLFGVGTTFNDINTFEKLFKLLDSPSFRYKDKKAEIIDTFKKDLVRLKLSPIKE